MNAFGGSRANAKPPDKGSFPLDHKSECRDFMERYLSCLASNSSDHVKCRDFSKAYLECRMEKGLMQTEDLNQLGFSPDHVATERNESPEGAKEAQGFTAGTGVKAKRRWYYFW